MRPLDSGPEMSADIQPPHLLDSLHKQEVLLKKEELLLRKEELLLKKESLLHQEEELLHKKQELLHNQEEMFVKTKSLANGGSDKTEHSEASSPPKVSFFKIFKYADKFDWFLMILGFVGAIGDGISTPAMMLFMSGLVDVFGKESSYTSDNFMHEIEKYALYFTYVAVGVWVAGYLEASCWIRTGERQASRLRSMYLTAILRQEVGFFDVQGTNTAEVINSVSVDTLTIQEALGEKVSHFTMNISTFVASYIVSFYLAWQLAVVSLAFLPFLIIPGLMYGRILAGLAQNMHVEYLKAATVVEQAISSIRTVFSFVGEEKTMRKFSAAMDGAVGLGLKQGLAKGLAIGSNGVTFGIWAFMAWYGSTLVMNHGLNGGKIIATGLSGIVGGLALGTALPNLKYFNDGSIAAYRIFAIINRVPAIDSDDMSGKVLQNVVGHLELKNISFAYPSRPDTAIFKNFSLAIPAGKTMALVGSSGSGKSTVVALLERFYDPLAGEVLVDGINIKHLQLKWLRRQIGLVSQEPALFATTIRDNIQLGKEEATMDEIIAAAKKSNAHHFISQLPEAYETQVGERGVQMSGGQKQRIAIARAMLKDPPILLLDEATSALDAESEQIVQEALDHASLGRTTVIVAHRLSTIRKADLIAVVSGGQVVEIGQHDELLEKEEGAYAALVQLQQKSNDEPVENYEEPRSSSMVRMSTSSWVSRTSTPRPSVKSGQLEYIPVPKTPSFRRLLALNRPEWKQAVLGSIGAIGFGVIQPMYAFILGSMVSAFYLQDHAEERRKVRDYSFGFAAVAVGSFLTNAIQHYNFGAMGEFLTKRVRERMLGKILSFEVGWFDEDENSSGAVCARIATEANVVRSLVGDRLSLIVHTLSAVVAACTFGLLTAWRLAIVMIAVQPLVIVCFYARKVIQKSMSNAALNMQQDSSQLAAEAVGNHRTITAFSAEGKVAQLLAALQAASEREARRQSVVAGIGLGTAQFTMFCTWALDFWYGGRLVSQGLLTGGDMFKTFFILVSTGRVIADAGSMTSDIAKGAGAVASVFSILDRESKIDPELEGAEAVNRLQGSVELQDVDFAYPARPDTLVFRNFCLRVRAGQSVALVGQSGSGKSTVIGLIERFYDPLRGRVRIDGKDIRKLNLRSLRKQIALVGQEPTLFSGTIRENILYGRDNATEAEMVEAAKAANAHEFISSLSSGYDTPAGDRGTQLSGGQKQRIAIARAILKNPSILLLDEATSALDAHSEKLVQDALDRIMIGRTTIVVAHRLSTIQNCDSIAVVQDGSIVEQGRHADLLSKQDGGAYFNLVKLQNKSD